MIEQNPGTNKADKIISIIDRALGIDPDEQESLLAASAYCWRCTFNFADPPGMMCPDCRAWMHGESDVDPKEERFHPESTTFQRIMDQFLGRR